jgi:hypothetical protein
MWADCEVLLAHETASAPQFLKTVVVKALDWLHPSAYYVFSGDLEGYCLWWSRMALGYHPCRPGD